LNPILKRALATLRDFTRASPNVKLFPDGTFTF
jgi:hypothetical protein